MIILRINKNFNPLSKNSIQLMSEGTNPFNETGTNLLPSTNLDFDEASTSRVSTLTSPRHQP